MTVYSCGDDYIDSRAAVRGKFIEAALTVLREAPPDAKANDEQKALKHWARDIINKHSSVELSDEAVRGFAGIYPRPGLPDVLPEAATYPLVEGRPVSIPEFGVEQMSVTFQQKEGQHLALVKLRLQGQDEVTLTVVPEVQSGALYPLANSPHTLLIDKFYPEVPILLLRIGPADMEDTEEPPANQ